MDAGTQSPAKTAVFNQLKWDSELLAEALEYSGYYFPDSLIPIITNILAITLPHNYLTKDQLSILSFQEELIKALDLWAEHHVDAEYLK